MINIDDILESAIKQDASDLHLICGIKPTFRIRRQLLSYDGCEVLTPEDMMDIYDYLIRGDVNKDQIFQSERKLDSSLTRLSSAPWTRI